MSCVPFFVLAVFLPSGLCRLQAGAYRAAGHVSRFRQAAQESLSSPDRTPRLIPHTFSFAGAGIRPKRGRGTHARCGGVVSILRLTETPGLSTMEAEESRLSRIETIWSVVRRAHDTSERSANAALQQLLNQYGGAVRRYLLGALRREDAADDVFQEFAMRFVRGDFRGADPDRGRFRNYLKTSLYRLVVDYQRREKCNGRQVIPREFAAEEESPAWERMNDEFDASWRSELLAKAWTALAQQEADTGKPYHTVLRLRADHTELSVCRTRGTTLSEAQSADPSGERTSAASSGARTVCRVFVGEGRGFSG